MLKASVAARAVAWLVLIPAIWLTLASLIFLWLGDALLDPRIAPWSRPYAWLRYAPYIGRDLWESLYLALAAVMAATPLIVLVRWQVSSLGGWRGIRQGKLGIGRVQRGRLCCKVCQHLCDLKYS